MKRPSARRSPSHNLAIVLAFSVSAIGAACTLDTGDVDSVGGAAGSGALAGSATAGAGATGGSSAGTTATGGSSAGTTATGGSSGTGPNPMGGSSTGGGMAAGSGGKGGSGGSNTAGTGGMLSTGGSAGTAAGSGGSGAVGGTGGTGGGEVPDEPYCAVTETWDPEHAAMEEEIVVLVNQYRAEGASCGDEEMPPVGPLTMDPSLQCAARVHSKDMADRDFFDHDNPDGDGPSERMDEAGYDGRGWGENIAAGRDTAVRTMDQWMNSPGHCLNLMGEDYTLIGVGYYPGGEYGHLWTQTFGD